MGTIITGVIFFCLFGAAMHNAEQDNWPMFWLFIILFILGILVSPIF